MTAIHYLLLPKTLTYSIPIMELYFIILIIAALLIILPIVITKDDDKPKPAPQQPQKTDAEVLAQAKRLLLLTEVKRQAEAAGDTATVQAVLEMTYAGKMPIEKPDGTYTNIYKHVVSYSIAGINYRDHINRYVGSFMGYLQPEPDNTYDPDAIAIYHDDGHHLGYIPANRTAAVRQNCKTFPYSCFGVIESFSEDDDEATYDGYKRPSRTYYSGMICIEV